MEKKENCHNALGSAFDPETHLTHDGSHAPQGECLNKKDSCEEDNPSRVDPFFSGLYGNCIAIV